MLGKALPLRLQRLTSSGKFIPEIDGFRFLAISSVILAHIVIIFLRNSARGLQLDPALDSVAVVLKRGTFGVEFFFVISGFILALPFVQHLVHGGPPVGIGRYYLRRLTRLEPPYILCLIGFYAASAMLGESDMARSEYVPSFLSRLLYSHGLFYGKPPVLNGVTWTLEIEVQFYVLVPLFASVFRLSAPIRRGLFLALMLLCPWIVWHTHTATITLPAFIHYFAAGFLLADLYLDVIVPHPQARLRNDLLAVAVLVAVWAWPMPEFQRPKLLAVFIAAFYFLVFRSVLLRRFFSNPWITAIGGMCYSIYLLHYPLLVLLDRIVWKVAPGLAFPRGVLSLAAIGIPTVALISVTFFVLIERPCMDSRWPAKLGRFFRRRPAREG